MTGPLACLAAAGALMFGAPASEPVTIEPDTLPAVVQASRALGWPHHATPAERAEVTRLARLDLGAPVTCRPWPGRTAGQWFCDLAVLRVWEDGSHRWIVPADLH